MKKTGIILVLMLSGFILNAQKFDKLDKSPMDVAAFPKSRKTVDKVVKVTYSRPQLKGRAIKDLVPFGEVWRTGANETTEITFYKNVIFGGKKVVAGTYSLFTIPREKEWEVILSRDINTWGASVYNKDNDVVRVLATVKVKTKSLEAFSIAFDKKMNFYMGWGAVLVTLPIREEEK